MLEIIRSECSDRCYGRVLPNPAEVEEIISMPEVTVSEREDVERITTRNWFDGLERRRKNAKRRRAKESRQQAKLDFLASTSVFGSTLLVLGIAASCPSSILIPMCVGIILCSIWGWLR